MYYMYPELGEFLEDTPVLGCKQVLERFPVLAVGFV